jgi:hypothetical protein
MKSWREINGRIHTTTNTDSIYLEPLKTKLNENSNEEPAIAIGAVG